MAKKLKTYETSLGFFDLAIAAPSMKAALEAWGADSNLFHQGAAKQSEDPDVVAATMAKPGVMLKRPVGSNGPSRSTPLCRRTSARMDGRSLPTSHQPRRRNLRPNRTRRQIGRSLKRTNGRGNAASARKPRKRRLGRRSANAGSRPSTRRKRLLKKRSRSTRDGPPRCARALLPPLADGRQPVLQRIPRITFLPMLQPLGALGFFGPTQRPAHRIAGRLVFG